MPWQAWQVQQRGRHGQSGQAHADARGGATPQPSATLKLAKTPVLKVWCRGSNHKYTSSLRIRAAPLGPAQSRSPITSSARRSTADLQTRPWPSSADFLDMEYKTTAAAMGLANIRIVPPQPAAGKLCTGTRRLRTSSLRPTSTPKHLQQPRPPRTWCREVPSSIKWRLGSG